MPPNQSEHNQQLEEICRFWRHIFGRERGLLQVWTGERVDGEIPKKTVQYENFNYPRAADTAAQWALKESARGREVYFCAHLLRPLKPPTREKKGAAEVRSLWADLDGAPVPNGRLTPSCIVETSPGNYHCYWRLMDSIPPEVAESLNRRLAAEIGADSGWHLGKILRVPGTSNHKYPDCPTVKVVKAFTFSHVPRDLDELLPRMEEHETEPEDMEDEPPVQLGPDALRVWRGEKPVHKDDGSGIDRSRSLVNIGRVLYDAGANRAVVIAGIKERDAALGWRCYTSRRDADKQYAAIFDNVLKPEGRSASFSSYSTNSTNRTNSANRTNPSGAISAADLMAMEFAPTRWVIPDILPEGVSLLAGKPKKGKSWMALQMCEAVATGGVAFGVKHVEQGDALYLALEDNNRRLQGRLRKMLEGRSAPERMYLHTQWPRIDEGGAEALDEWLDKHPDARLVVIDTLARFRKPAKGQNVYAEDYAALAQLKPLYEKHGVAFPVVHHLRKMSASDPIDEINSSTGLTASVDGFMILRRSPNGKGSTLYVDGRDIEKPTEYALHWNINTATWTIEGDAEEVHVSNERADILRVLNRYPEPMSPREVADAMGPSARYNNIKYLMWAMYNDGQLDKNDKGKYEPATRPNEFG